jgi:DNA invertase Pin-like site-specific DNA recombinase
VIQTTGPAVIYVRISEDRDKDGLGVERQEKDCRELAKRLKWEVEKVYSDNNVSASKKGVVRPEYQQLLKDIEAGKVRRLILDKPDRLWRKNKELEHLIDVIEQHPIEIAVVKSGDIDLNTTNGKMIARILGATAQAEAETIRDRIKRKMEDKISKGEWVGGPRPFGFDSVDKRLVQVPKEIALLRAAKDNLIAGKKSIHVICMEWKAAGQLSARDKTIAETTLVKMLTSPRMIGEYDGGIKGDWEPVLERPEWEKLRAILKTRPSSKRREGGVYLLTGEILKCANCGGPLYGLPTYGGAWVGGTKETGGTFVKKNVPYYTCRKTVSYAGCSKVAMRASAVDDEVMRQIADYLTPFIRVADFAEDEDERKRLLAENPNDFELFLPVRRFKESPTLAAASAEMVKVQEDERRINEMLGDGLLDKNGYRDAKARLAPRLKAATAALEAAQGHLAGLHELAALDPVRFVSRWREMSRDERRRVVLALVAEVRVKRHHNGDRSMRTTPDLHRVTVTFRPELAG